MKKEHSLRETCLHNILCPNKGLSLPVSYPLALYPSVEYEYSRQLSIPTVLEWLGDVLSFAPQDL
jgi:hypothetical protein